MPFVADLLRTGGIPAYLIQRGDDIAAALSGQAVEARRA
jgi:hypothetical protein